MGGVREVGGAKPGFNGGGGAYWQWAGLVGGGAKALVLTQEDSQGSLSGSTARPQVVLLAGTTARFPAVLPLPSRRRKYRLQPLVCTRERYHCFYKRYNRSAVYGYI